METNVETLSRKVISRAYCDTMHNLWIQLCNQDPKCMTKDKFCQTLTDNVPTEDRWANFHMSLLSKVREWDASGTSLSSQLIIAEIKPQEWMFN